MIESAYADSRNLRARQSIYRYRLPPLDPVEFAFDLIEWRGDERLLDLGCGPGHYIAGFRARIPGLRPVLADRSPGMLAEAASHGPSVCLDAMTLPFADGAFDVAIAMHMLYHVPVMDSAIAELRRVTTRWGTILVSTNSIEHLREIKALFDEAVASVSGRPVQLSPSPVARFSLENGEAMLSQAFASVRRKAAWGTLAITDPDSIVSYVDSMRSLRLPAAEDDEWEAILAYVRRRSEAVIAERGSFDAATRSGIFVCR